MPRKPHDYQPSAELLAHFPPVSGNTINGLGETVPRQPSPFFWHPADRQPFGDLQRYIVTSLRPKSSEDYSFRNPNVDRGPPPVPVAGERVPPPPEGWTALIKAFALANEADQVGITPLLPHYVYQGYQVDEPNVIVLGVQHVYERLATAPASHDNPTAYQELHQQYNRGARAAAKLANHIRARGYQAKAWLGPMADALNMVPAAIAAGFGELGKHGSIINRHFGSGFRLAAVTTDMPLDFDAPDTFGADDFCLNCQVCTDACPPVAISDAKQMVRGEERWYVDFDACIPYFGENYACGICIAVCPWTRPGIADRLVEKMGRRRAA
jgi:epoxyqueuosine reductase